MIAAGVEAVRENSTPGTFPALYGITDERFNLCEI